MNSKITISNRSKIENEIIKLSHAIGISGLYDDVIENPEKYNPLIKELFKIQYIKDNCDIDILIQILDSTNETCKENTKLNFIDTFINIVQSLYIKWVIIFPLDYNTMGFSKPIAGTKTIQKYKILPPQKTPKQFNNSIKKHFGSIASKTEIIEHQNRQTRGLLTRPLLCVETNGSRVMARQKGYEYYKYFRYIQDLFIAHYGTRSCLFNELSDYNRHFFELNIENGDLDRNSLQGDSKVLWRYDESIFKIFVRNNFTNYANLIFENKNKLFDRLYNSLLFFSKGFNEGDKISRFLYYVVSLESIFSKDKYQPIKTTIADYVALLCFKSEARLNIYNKVREIYDVRSAKVHSGQHFITSEIIEEAQNITAKALIESLKLYEKLKSHENPEKEFFNELLNLKLK